MRVAVDGFVPSMEEGNAGVSGDLFHCLTFWDPGSIPTGALCGLGLTNRRVFPGIILLGFPPIKRPTCLLFNGVLGRM